MFVIYEFRSDVVFMFNYLSGELYCVLKFGGLGFDLLFRFLLLFYVGGKIYVVKIFLVWNEKFCDFGCILKGCIFLFNIENFVL